VVQAREERREEEDRRDRQQIAAYKHEGVQEGNVARSENPADRSGKQMPGTRLRAGRLAPILLASRGARAGCPRSLRTHGHLWNFQGPKVGPNLEIATIRPLLRIVLDSLSL
jgi:hypothetical protein